MYSNSDGGSYPYEAPGGAVATVGWGSGSSAAQYVGYAAVPCIMVPTGDPVFYAHMPAYQRGRSGQSTSDSACSAGQQALQLRAPSTSYAQHARYGTTQQQFGGRGGCRKQQQRPPWSQPTSADSVRGTHSRSVSSFSSITGFYAFMDSSSESSQQDTNPPDRGRGQGDPEQPASDWGHLTVGILQHILTKLVDAEVKQLRCVCRHWRGAIDQNLDTLTPSALMSKLITLRFPNLKLLHLTNCSNVRNRDLQLLSNGGLRLHTLTLGDDANRPWVSNIGLSWISKVTTLTALNLQDCTQLTNRGLQPLQHLTGLAALSLKGCNKLNNMGLEGLRHNTALTSLNLSGCARVSDCTHNMTCCWLARARNGDCLRPVICVRTGASRQPSSTSLCLAALRRLGHLVVCAFMLMHSRLCACFACTADLRQGSAAPHCAPQPPVPPPGWDTCQG